MQVDPRGMPGPGTGSGISGSGVHSSGDPGAQDPGSQRARAHRPGGNGLAWSPGGTASREPRAPLDGPEADLSQYRGHPVQLEAFQGPLDLLLHLIKKDRIEIWEISISRITRQYLEYLATLRSLNIEVAGEFLVMAATLMRIKSQNLLPRPSFLSEEDEGEEPATKEALIARLLEYRRFREAARTLSGLEWEQSRMHSRGRAEALERGTLLPLREPKLIDLAEYFQELLSRKEPTHGHQVHLEEVLLEDQIDWVDRLLDRLEDQQLMPDGETRGFPFGHLLRRRGMRLEVVVTLLAILELARVQRLRVWQRQILDEIWISPRTDRAAMIPSEFTDQGEWTRTSEGTEKPEGNPAGETGVGTEPAREENR